MYLSAVGRVIAAQNSEQRALAATIQANNSDSISVADGEGNIGK
jgi:hypothetical protein